MVSEVRIYVEGGGDQADGKARLRAGFSSFLREVVDLARQQRIRWSIIACGSRTNTFEDFQHALERHVHAFNILLVDAEGPVQTDNPWTHLRHRDGWLRPERTEDDQCHMMVQCMEAWFLADRAALVRFYGQGFAANALPRQEQVERIAKDHVSAALHQATRQTTKGAYHKIQHGTHLLGMVDPALVRSVAPSCERLFSILRSKLSA